jgi:hypothetical protein
MTRWKKELAIFLGIFLFLALGMHHKEWLSHPIQQIESLPESSLGPWHPLYIAFGVYLVVLMLRLLIGGIGKIFKKG